MNKNLYLDMHILQTVPPSCVNRDDTGSPKTATYGGVTRARVSSQSWKRAMRLMFEDLFKTDDVGQRTKRVVDQVARYIDELGEYKDSTKLASKALENAGIKVNKESKTDALLFFSKAQAKELAKLIVAGEEDKQLYKNALKNIPSIDMALFGRMVASDQSLNYDAAAQVAHSISVHEVHNEYDYFTAVDDCAPEDNTGAGHLGTVEFNSSTLYRYATVNITELAQMLGDKTPETILGFVKAFILSMPTGKQNTFANRTVPDFAYITLRNDQPVNLVGAFEKPVRANGDGYVINSLRALEKYADKVYNSFVSKPEKAFCVSVLDDTQTLAQSISMNELITQVGEQISEICTAEEGNV